MNEIQTEETGPRVSFTAVLASMVGVWFCYYVLTTLRGVIVGLEMQDALLWRRGLVTLAGLAVTLALWLVLRLFDARPLWMKASAALVLSLPAALIIAQVNQMAFASLNAELIRKMGEDQGITMRQDEAGNVLVEVPGMPERYDGAVGNPSAPPSTVSLSPYPSKGLERWRQITDIALGRYFLLLAWASLYFALLAVSQERAAERREERFRSAAKAAELLSLRYQVNPHFLFNTLNSLSALVLTGKPDRAEQMIQSISSFYRHSLADDPTSDVSLSDEFALQRLYLDIEGVRFPERLRTVFELPGDLENARIPGMILQPLIENSVKYAVARVTRPVTIIVSAREEFDRLVVSVSDDGPGVPGGDDHGFGIGLANVRDRLEARFGPDVTLDSGPVPGGYRSELRIPLTRRG